MMIICYTPPAHKSCCCCSDDGAPRQKERKKKEKERGKTTERRCLHVSMHTTDPTGDTCVTGGPWIASFFLFYFYISRTRADFRSLLLVVQCWKIVLERAPRVVYRFIWLSTGTIKCSSCYSFFFWLAGFVNYPVAPGFCYNSDDTQNHQLRSSFLQVSYGRQIYRHRTTFLKNFFFPVYVSVPLPNTLPLILPSSHVCIFPYGRRSII